MAGFFYVTYQSFQYDNCHVERLVAPIILHRNKLVYLVALGFSEGKSQPMHNTIATRQHVSMIAIWITHSIIDW